MESIISPLNIELGRRIKRERERLGLNQESFGSINGLTSRTVIDWEKGKTFPNLMQLVKLVEIGLDLSALFNGIFQNSAICHLTCCDIHFDKKTGDYLSVAMGKINKIFADHPSWKLINIETMYSPKGEQIALRIFYRQPTQIIYDESQVVRESYIDELIRDVKKQSYTNK